MVNSLVATTISQNGLDRKSPMAARRQASLLFSRVIRRSKQRTFWQKLLRKENKLQDLAQIAAVAKRQPAKQTGIVSVPLTKIVGSDGRTQDFDSSFNPLNAHIHDRWVGIVCARRRGVTLPPVEVIQVGDEFYVRDGHHRISVAHAVGRTEIEAQILYTLERSI